MPEPKIANFGFAVGFFGPILFNPEVTQGPLLGIFITGPFGAIIGAIMGAVIGYKKSKEPKYSFVQRSLYNSQEHRSIWLLTSPSAGQILDNPN